MNQCRGCDDSYRMTAERAERYIAIAQFNPADCVEENVYERRLQSCRSCISLTDGYTCAVCGCIVQIRARLLAKDCPRSEGSRWRSIAE